jgi:L-threonylcarbamoyladenylate synthase
LVQNLLNRVKRIGWLRLTSMGDASAREQNQVQIVEMPLDAAAYSQRLYAALHELDHAAVDCIVVDLPPPGDEWLAVHDRLRRASTSAATT